MSGAEDIISKIARKYKPDTEPIDEYSPVDDIGEKVSIAPDQKLKSVNQEVDSGSIDIDAVKADADIANAISKAHTQNSDAKLDEGGANEVTAAQAKTGYSHSQVSSGNPHSVSKSDVGLGYVQNPQYNTYPRSLTSGYYYRIGYATKTSNQDTWLGEFLIFVNSGVNQIQVLRLSATATHTGSTWTSKCVILDNDYTTKVFDEIHVVYSSSYCTIYLRACNADTYTLKVYELQNPVLLGGVKSYSVTAFEESSSITADLVYTIESLDEKISAAETHHNNTSNPHSVTKTQVSLSNVRNPSRNTYTGISLTIGEYCQIGGFNEGVPASLTGRFKYALKGVASGGDEFEMEFILSTVYNGVWEKELVYSCIRATGTVFFDRITWTDARSGFNLYLRSAITDADIDFTVESIILEEGTFSNTISPEPLFTDLDFPDYYPISNLSMPSSRKEVDDDVSDHNGLSSPHSSATSIGGKTLPSGSIIGTSDTQTLTNKSIRAGQNSLYSIRKVKAVEVLYSDTPDKLILAAVDGIVVTNAWVRVNTAFSGIGGSGTITVGDSGNNTGFLTEFITDIGTIGWKCMNQSSRGGTYIWDSAPVLKGYSSSTDIYAYFDFDGATTGKLTVYLEYYDVN